MRHLTRHKNCERPGWYVCEYPVCGCGAVGSVEQYGAPEEHIHTGGVKHDGDKVRFDLMPPEALTGMAQVLTFGAKKYGDRNWEKGMPWGRLFAAALRHLLAWWHGEDTDQETGLSHLHHVACCIAFLQAYEARKLGLDDRPTGVRASAPEQP